ncbi:MAG: hypothetical protein JSU63_02195 [Phycisphaerales bacterium]|nr:MAG: hypothetical protein JSU63_02195 [Phycisphaerales bacterium]
MTRLLALHIETLILLILVGCTAAPTATQDRARRRMLALLMPARVEIVEPFTRVKSFDDDSTPDGIELLLQAVNSFDDPGMIVGSVHCELYEYVPASGDDRGRRLEYWDIELATALHQRTFWNQATQMYEFRLQVDPTKIPVRDRFVLRVVYSTPLGEHLTDECIIDYRSAKNKWSRRTPRTSAADGG